MMFLSYLEPSLFEFRFTACSRTRAGLGTTQLDWEELVMVNILYWDLVFILAHGLEE